MIEKTYKVELTVNVKFKKEHILPPDDAILFELNAINQCTSKELDNIEEVEVDDSFIYEN